MKGDFKETVFSRHNRADARTTTVKHDRPVKALAKAPPHSKTGNTPSSGCSTLTGPDLGRTQHKVI